MEYVALEVERPGAGGTDGPVHGIERDMEPGPRYNPDRFVRRLYRYYVGRGLRCMLTTEALDIARICFICFLAITTLGATSYGDLGRRAHHHTCPDGSDNGATLFEADCYGNRPVSYARLRTGARGGLAGAVVAASAVYLAYRVLRTAVGLGSLVETRRFYRDRLGVSDATLQTARWDEDIVPRLLAISSNTSLTALHVTGFLTRRDNFLIALLQDKHLRSTFFGRDFYPLVLHRALSDTFAACIYDGAAVRVTRNTVQHAAHSMRRNLRQQAAGYLVLMPLVMVLRIVHAVFQYANEWRSSPSTLGLRQWTALARWRMRHYCEPPHVHERRLARAHRPAGQYVAMFHSELAAVWARFLVFVLGGAFTLLLLLTLVFDEGMLVVALTPGRTITWWLGVLGIGAGLCRAFVPDENAVPRPAAKMQEIIALTHFEPVPGCTAREHCAEVKDAFQRLFAPRILVLLDELLGVVLAPVYLGIVYPAQAEHICDAFAELQRTDAVVGTVCVYAQLDAQVDAQPQPDHMSVGGSASMSSSLVHFQQRNPQWLPQAMAGSRGGVLLSRDA